MKSLKKNEPQYQHPFRVPDGYFETLPERIESSIVKAKPQAKLIAWQHLGLAAAAAVSLLVVVLILNKDPQQISAQDLLASVSDQEIITYLKASDIESYEITSGMQNLHWDYPVLPDLEQGLTDEELLDELGAFDKLEF